MAKQFIVYSKNHGPQEFPGQELASLGMFIYKNDIKGIDWCVCDTASGTLIKSGFKTAAEAKAYATSMSEEELERIKTQRAKQGYKEHCKMLQKLTNVPETVKKAYNKLSFSDAFDELDKLNDPEPQYYDLFKDI